MSPARMETFTDGVIAIFMTIMVLELRVPTGVDLSALWPMVPVFLSYLLSFVFLGIYWNNHHHMMVLTDEIDGGVLWANLHLLFWLSLVPFATSWMGEHHVAPLPTALYGCVLLLAAVAYTILQVTIIRRQGPSSKLKAAVGKDKKGVVSLVLYASAIPLAFVHQLIAVAIYVFVAMMWLVPDPRIEEHLSRHTEDRQARRT